MDMPGDRSCGLPWQAPWGDLGKINIVRGEGGLSAGNGHEL